MPPPAFLKDHQLKGVLVTPAVAYVDGVKAANELLGAAYLIENFAIPKPMIRGERHLPRADVRSRSPTDPSFQIFSRREGGRRGFDTGGTSSVASAGPRRPETGRARRST